MSKPNFVIKDLLMKQFILLLLFLFMTAALLSQNIGIGTPTPAFRLDVQGRMRVKTGTLGNVNTSSGIWFEDYRNGTNQFFFGMMDSIRGGFYGSGAGVGWDMVFNTRTGIFGDKFSLNGPILLHSGVTDHSGGSIRADSNDIYIESRKGITAGAKGNLILQYTDILNPNNPGNVGIGTNSPEQKLDVSGNIQTSGEYLRPATGNANLVPVCYGTVDPDGTIVTGSGNFSIEMTQTFIGYRIKIPGIAVTVENSVIIVTPNSANANLVCSVSNPGGLFEAPCAPEPCDIQIVIREINGAPWTNARFSFVIYKP